ncbi:hypothetical protein Btru_022201 [Bulinus truncatus]|nr:hypothetical protein Btru_022201 [Bulinus truncatus]
METFFLLCVSVFITGEVYSGPVQRDSCQDLQQCYHKILNYTENLWDLIEENHHRVACQKNEEFMACYDNNKHNCGNPETLKQVRIKKDIMTYLCSDEGIAGLSASAISICLTSKMAVRRADQAIQECTATFKKEVTEAKAEFTDSTDFDICPYAEDLMNCVFDSTSRHCRVGYATVVVVGGTEFQFTRS